MSQLGIKMVKNWSFTFFIHYSVTRKYQYQLKKGIYEKKYRHLNIHFGSFSQASKNNVKTVTLVTRKYRSVGLKIRIFESKYRLPFIHFLKKGHRPVLKGGSLVLQNPALLYTCVIA